MELTLEAEIYAPGINDSGIYIDKIPNVFHGLRCPCSSRRDKSYTSRQCFVTHTKTKTHQKWLEELNNNRMNFFVRSVKLSETIKAQQQIIAKLETDIQNKLLTIDCLTKMIAAQQKTANVTADLLEMSID